jgi:hypothetical protein
MKSGNLNFLEPSGPLQACNGTALKYIHHYFFSKISNEKITVRLRAGAPYGPGNTVLEAQLPEKEQNGSDGSQRGATEGKKQLAGICQMW